MSDTFNLPKDIMLDIERVAKKNKRSALKQLVHWIRIGKIVEENPEMSYQFIRETLLAI